MKTLDIQGYRNTTIYQKKPKDWTLITKNQSSGAIIKGS